MGPLWSLVDSDVFKLIVALQAGLALLLSMRVLLSAFGCRVPGGFLAEPFFRQFIVRIFEITMWLGGPWYVLFGALTGEPLRGLAMGLGWVVIWLLLRRIGGEATREFLHMETNEAHFSRPMLIGIVGLALLVSPPWLLLFVVLALIA